MAPFRRELIYYINVTLYMEPSTTTDNGHAIEIFRQLQGQKVNRFPFFAYTGIKQPQILTANSIIMKVPGNPGRISQLVVELDPSDTYNVIFYKTKKGQYVEKARYSDIYAEGLVDLIVDAMGVR